LIKTSEYPSLNVQLDLDDFLAGNPFQLLLLPPVNAKLNEVIMSLEET
jgi:hypothetical protein